MCLGSAFKAHNNCVPGSLPAVCVELMEYTHELLKAIISVYIKSDTGPELPPSILKEIMKFTEYPPYPQPYGHSLISRTLHKIHNCIEAQQSSSRVKKFFRQGELNELLKGCKEGLQEGLDFFQIKTADIIKDITHMQDQAQFRHQEILDILETMSSSDSASSVCGRFSTQISKMYSGSYASSNSISMLPAEPKIFHGRDSELGDILKLFRQGTPRIAILGAGGMGKTSVAKIVVHHEEVTTKYHRNRFFVACDTASSKPELAGLIGAHLGMKPGKDLTRAVLQHFSSGPPSLLILDNLETVWEPIDSRREIKEFLSLLTDINSLALMHPLEEVDQILGLTDNMPLSISLLAHLVDMEGCKEILSRWEVKKTSLISDGCDRRSNLELSISLSLSSPRIGSTPQAQDLLAFLSMLPDGLSDVELKQTKFPITDILSCKAALLRTALAYTDGHKRLKVLVPIREYMEKLFPPTDQIIQPMFKHFHELLDSYRAMFGTSSGTGPMERITLNYTNIQKILQTCLTRENHNLVDVIYCTFQSWQHHPIPNLELLIVEALNCFKCFDDPDLEAHHCYRLYCSFGHLQMDNHTQVQLRWPKHQEQYRATKDKQKQESAAHNQLRAKDSNSPEISDSHQMLKWIGPVKFCGILRHFANIVVKGQVFWHLSANIQAIMQLSPPDQNKWMGKQLIFIEDGLLVVHDIKWGSSMKETKERGKQT
ncbi:hypothetical protein B0H16DRAFT_1448485 [Mycena metata]|uniref:Novel STAND NTPase 1 domain-containing protein n=1 Tax=Mycena metata TaxID=1033252 RepID=A0AAD7NWN5_9AGAR|nr:hypothetical protein B0H16DRAFT_1448485 [Mycena metata]